MSKSFVITAAEAILVVEPIPLLEELERAADERDLCSVAGFTAESRCRERLAWRRVLRRISPDAEVEYEMSGAPLLKNSPYTHISVSHCRDSVAVALSCHVCGVDMERLDRDFSRVAERYMTEHERGLSPEAWWMAAVWCAKECLYKMAGREGVDFRRDMAVEAIDTTTRSLVCRGVGGGSVTLQYAMPDGEHIVVYWI